MQTSVHSLLPDKLSAIISRLRPIVLEQLEELRIREGKPLEVNYQGKYAFVSPRGELTASSAESYKPDREDCVQLLDIVTNHSMYSFEEELRRGYITVRGGHRVGIAGRAVLDRGHVKLLRDISSFNIRVAREIRGVGERIVRALMEPASETVHHTLIISPPQCGKTTLIRDLARILSEGSWNGAAAMISAKSRGLKVGIVDERSEIAGSVAGVPSFDVGPRTDVLDACPKAEGMMMMIRSLSPQVLIVDEIGRREDADAVLEAMHAGIRVIATAHGRDIADVRRRPGLLPLFEQFVFTRYVVLEGTGVDRRISLFDKMMRQLEMPVHKAGTGS